MVLWVAQGRQVFGPPIPVERDPFRHYTPAPSMKRDHYRRMPRYNPCTLRWWAGRLTVDDPVTGKPVDVFPEDEPARSALPPAAQAALDADPMLTREEAGRFLGVASRTLAEWASAGRGPPYLDYGHTARYRLSDLVAWRNAQVKGGDRSEPAPAAEVRRRGPTPGSAPRRAAVLAACRSCV